jgi:hypothetical protein
LLLNNSKIRNVIDTITTKAVLILGRFTPERKTTLDALRDALRSHNYLPILFGFEKPTNRDFTETAVLQLSGGGPQEARCRRRVRLQSGTAQR